MRPPRQTGIHIPSHRVSRSVDRLALLSRRQHEEQRAEAPSDGLGCDLVCQHVEEEAPDRGVVDAAQVGVVPELGEDDDRDDEGDERREEPGGHEEEPGERALAELPEGASPGEARGSGHLGENEHDHEGSGTERDGEGVAGLVAARSVALEEEDRSEHGVECDARLRAWGERVSSRSNTEFNGVGARQRGFREAAAI